MADRRWTKWTRWALLAAAGASLICVIQLQPATAGAFAFLALWLALPLAGMAWLLQTLARRGTPAVPWCVVALLVTLGGLFVLADAIYWHPDPQSAIGVVLTPIYQTIAFGFMAPLAWWSARRKPR